MDAAMIHHRSCHPTPEASPLAVGEAGYGWIGMVVSRLVRPSDCLLGYGPCSPSRATVLFAAASGGAGWAASAQPCRCTLPAMLSSRRAFAGVGFGGLWRSPHVAPPWPRASACPSFGFAGAVRTAVPWQLVPAIFASGFERAVLFSMLSAGEVRTAGTVAFQAPSTIARFSFRRAFSVLVLRVVVLMLLPQGRLLRTISGAAGNGHTGAAAALTLLALGWEGLSSGLPLLKHLRCRVTGYSVLASLPLNSCGMLGGAKRAVRDPQLTRRLGSSVSTSSEFSKCKLRCASQLLSITRTYAPSVVLGLISVPLVSQLLAISLLITSAHWRSLLLSSSSPSHPPPPSSTW